MKYKVGDKVKVREWDDMVEEFGTDEDGDIDCNLCFVKDMKEYCGKEMTVSSVLMSRVLIGYYTLEEDDMEWQWTDDMLCNL